jgi:hypothetical protein
MRRALVITIGAVVMLGAVLAYLYLGSRAFEERKCPDGRIVDVPRPQPFLLKYSGVSAVASLRLKNTLLGEIKVEERVLQDAVLATQLLDQRLRLILIEARATACEPRGQSLLARIREYMDVDLVRLAARDKSLQEIAATKDPSQRARGEGLLREHTMDVQSIETDLARRAEGRPR